MQPDPFPNHKITETGENLSRGAIFPQPASTCRLIVQTRPFTQVCAVCSPLRPLRSKPLLRPDRSDPIRQRGVQGQVVAITSNLSVL